QIGQQYALEIGQRKRSQRLTMLNSRIGKKDIEAAMLIKQFIDGARRLVDIGNVEWQGMRIDASLAQNTSRLIQRGSITPVQNDDRPPDAHDMSRGETNATQIAENQCLPAWKVEHVRVRLLLKKFDHTSGAWAKHPSSTLILTHYRYTNQT